MPPVGGYSGGVMFSGLGLFGTLLITRKKKSLTRNNILSMHLNKADRFLSLGALGTSGGLVAAIAALLCGILQFVISVSAAGAGRLLALTRERQVTVLWGVPALLRVLFELKSAPADLATLRVVRTFGDGLAFVNGIAIRITTGPVDSDVGAAAGNDVLVNLDLK